MQFQATAVRDWCALKQTHQTLESVGRNRWTIKPELSEHHRTIEPELLLELLDSLGSELVGMIHLESKPSSVIGCGSKPGPILTNTSPKSIHTFLNPGGFQT